MRSALRLPSGCGAVAPEQTRAEYLCGGDARERRLDQLGMRIECDEDATQVAAAARLKREAGVRHSRRQCEVP